MLETIKYQLKSIYSTKTQSNDGKRKTWLDMAKGICIILVVMGHRGFITPVVNVWLSTFHLPAFFIISGMLMEMKKEYEKPFKELFIKKCKSLLIPYFIFSLGTIPAVMLVSHDISKELITEILVTTFTFRGYSVLWFLSMTFFGELLFIAVNKWLKLNTACIVLTAFSIAFYNFYQGFVSSHGASTPLMIITKILIAATLIAFGSVLWPLFTKRESFSLKELIIGILLFFLNILWIALTNSGLLHLSIIGLDLNIRDLNNAFVGNIFTYYIIGTFVTVGLIYICKNCKNIPILTYYGQNSLIIMCTHLNYYILYFGTLIYLRFAFPVFINELHSSNLYTMIFTFILEIPAIFIINCFLPFVLGKKYK